MSKEGDQIRVKATNGDENLFDLVMYATGRNPNSTGLGLEALGVNTSKTFSIIETGEQLERGDEPSPTRSAVMVRLSHSHIRIGTFQRLMAYEEADHMEALVAYCLEHFPGVVISMWNKRHVLKLLLRPAGPGRHQETSVRCHRYRHPA